VQEKSKCIQNFSEAIDAKDAKPRTCVVKNSKLAMMDIK